MTFWDFLPGMIVLIVGLIILTGKAGFLIAGYNTLSPGQQARRDIKKISRFLGWMLIVGALVLFIGVALTRWGGPSRTIIMSSNGLFLVILLCGIVYMNVSNRFRVDVVQIDTKNLSRRRGLTVGWSIGLSVLIAGLAIIIGSKPPVYTVSDTNMKISGMYGRTIALSDIVSVRLDNKLPPNLLRWNGFAFRSILKGNFASRGTTMKLFVDASKPPFIYLDTSRGLVILNDQSADKTKALYQELQNRISAGQTKTPLMPR